MVVPDECPCKSAKQEIPPPFTCSLHGEFSSKLGKGHLHLMSGQFKPSCEILYTISRTFFLLALGTEDFVFFKKNISASALYHEDPKILIAFLLQDIRAAKEMLTNSCFTVTGRELTLRQRQYPDGSR